MLNERHRHECNVAPAGVFSREADAPHGEPRFANNENSEILKKDHPQSLWGLSCVGVNFVSAWGAMPQFVKGNVEAKSAFELVYGEVCRPVAALRYKNKKK